MVQRKESESRNTERRGIKVTERTRRLGIPDLHVYRALELVRAQRVQVIREGIDPRAYRIALIYVNKCDFHAARRRLSEDVLVELEKIADEFFRELDLRMQKRGVR